MRPRESPAASVTLERPVPVRGTHASVERRYRYGQLGPPVTVFNGELLDGEQEVEALPLLGIYPEELDRAWRAYVMEVNSAPYGYSPHSTLLTWKLDQQNEMGWRVDVEVSPDPRTELPELAYVDPRTLNRTVTYTATKWSGGAEGGGPLGPPMEQPTNGSRVEKSECLTAGGAFGAIWFGVGDEDIKATETAWKALQDAWMALQDAYDEIGVAHRVANASWDGVRAESAKFRFDLENKILASLRDVTSNWMEFLADVAHEQREAKKADDTLTTELAIGATIEVVSMIPFGRVFRLIFTTAKAAKKVHAAGKLGKWISEAAARGARVHGRLTTRLDKLRHSTAGALGLRVFVDGMKELATKAAVNSSNGKPVTAEDWYGIYVVAGLAGPITGSGFDALAKKAGIKDLVDKYGGKGVTERATKTGANSITSAALAAPFTIGVPVDVVKARTKAAIMKRLATRDLTPAQIEEYERYVDKSLGLAYGTPEKAAAKAYERHQKERPVPHPSGVAPGTVPRREGPSFPDGSELGEEVAN